MNNQASDLTAVGAGALSSNASATANTAVGWMALDNNDASGHGAGTDNTAVGHAALVSNTDGDSNTANGSRALMDNVTGRQNTAVGFKALQGNTNDFNTAVGALALSSDTAGFGNTAVGLFALENVTSGHNNIAIGAEAGLALNSSETFDIDIGNSGSTGDSGTIRIGDSALQTATFIAGIKGVNQGSPTAVFINTATGQLGTAPPSSSRRFKKEIKPMDKTSEGILAFKPVTFRYKDDNQGTPQFGLIAEDVAKVNPDLVVRDRNGEIYSVRYDAVNAMLLNEFLKEHFKVQELQATVAQQQKSFESKVVQQQKQIEALTAVVQKVSAQLEVTKPAPRTVLNNQ